MTTQSDKSSNPYKPPSASSYQPAPKKNWLWGILLLILILIIGVWIGRVWEQKQSHSAANEQVQAGQLDDNEKPVLTVEVATPQQTVIADALSADGTIAAKNTAAVSGKVNGVVIDQVLVQEGDWVKKGQVLAVFDSDAMQQQFVQAQADLAEAEARFKLAQSDAERVLPLLEINAVSEQEADRYVATANQAQAAMVAAQARLNNQSLNLDNAKVTAPVSGIISDKNAVVGSVQGQEPLFTIITNGALEWQAEVDPNELGDINVGTPVQVSLPQSREVMGKVSRIAPTASDQSRQVTIYAALEQSPYVRAGMYRRGKFLLGEQGQQVIPVSAVVSKDGYDYVMLVVDDKDKQGKPIYRVKQQKVDLGERQGDQVVLTTPLQDTDKLVRQGGGFLNNGDIVQVTQISTDTTTNTPTSTPTVTNPPQPAG